MWRAFLCLVLVLVMADSAMGAKRKKARKKAKVAPRTEESAEAVKPEKSEPVAKTEIPPEKPAETPVADTHDEMEAYRAIQKRKEAQVQDLADLLLMYRGEFGKYKNAAQRLARARELELIQEHQGDEKLDRGTLAYAIMKVYHPEKGLLYWITGWERYAMRDVQEAGIMPAKSTPGQNLSGEQLLGTITVAEEYVVSQKNWGK